MPKVGMESIRCASLDRATIAEIGSRGSLDVTVNQIARRAGVSSALAFHYFGSKDQILVSAMRFILSTYGAEVRRELAGVTTPRQRVEAVVRGSFAASNFRHDVISAWLNFYVQAQKSPDAARLLHVYKCRLRSNLLCGLRPLMNGKADSAAEGIASMIDGIYIREGLADCQPDPNRATTLVIDYLDHLMEAPA